jgi:hypothetical protein
LRISYIILLFALAFALFFLAPPFLNKQFPLFPLMKTGDVFDILTPLILIPLYWLLYQPDYKKPAKTGGTLIFMVLAAFWVEGQGMHLSANSISHLLKDMKVSDVYTLTNFYDEVLSHYLWHFGIVGLSALVIYRQMRSKLSETVATIWLTTIAGIIHGFSFFAIVIEAGTAPLGITFAVLNTIFLPVLGRKRIRQQPLVTFFFVAYLVAVLLFAGWAIYCRGLPQFSELGFI